MELKRVLDVAGALALLVVAAPFLLLGTATVWLTSGRPVFFGHERLGKGGRRFRCWKLRTMTAEAEAVLERSPELRSRHRNNGFKLPLDEDPRITPVGRWLRPRYLDEVPQLFNVLEGTMSLFGPRPIVKEELEWYGEEAERLLSVRPGVFGAWVSQGRRRPDYPRRAEVELEYVRNRNVARDLRVLAGSVRAVFEGQAEP